MFDHLVGQVGGEGGEGTAVRIHRRQVDERLHLGDVLGIEVEAVGGIGQQRGGVGARHLDPQQDRQHAEVTRDRPQDLGRAGQLDRRRTGFERLVLQQVLHAALGALDLVAVGLDQAIGFRPGRLHQRRASEVLAAQAR